MKFQLIAIILLLAFSCKAQNQLTNMDKFDIQLYEQNKGASGKYKYLSQNKNRDSISIELSKSGSIYQKVIYKINTPFRTVYEYDTKTLYPTTILDFFYNCSINKMQQYKPNGELLKEIDLDIPFKFSWQDLIDMMKIRYGIDLLDMKIISKISVTRNTETMLYYINIDTGKTEFIMGMNSLIKESFAVDGKTGEIVYWSDKDGNVQIDKTSERYSSNGNKGNKKGFWSALMD